MRVDAGALLIRNGFTHYPQEREAFRFFKGDRNMPSRIIMLDGSGGLSFAVLDWLASQRVGFAKIDYRGAVTSLLACGTSILNYDKVRWQIETRADRVRRLAFGVDLVSSKISASLVTIRTSLPDSPARVNAIRVANATVTALQSHAPQDAFHLMLAEGRAAAAYFKAWREMPMRWKKGHHGLVPQQWLAVQARRSYRTAKSSTNRNATHPVNAMLNYAYAVLHSKVQANALADGFDPSRGILHESRDDRSAFILDMMETFRPTVDAAILAFINKNVFSASDFLISNDGVCRLAPQLARQVAHLTSVHLQQHNHDFLGQNCSSNSNAFALPS